MKSGRIKKTFENWNEIKIIKKTRVLKFIWKLKSQKLNLKIGIFFKKTLKMVVLKIKLKQNGILDIKFERNWNFRN